MYQDTPMHQIGWDYETLIYGDQPMGRDQIGTKENIMAFQQADFLNYRSKLYTADNVVIAVAGNISHEDVMTRIEKMFDFEKGKKAYSCSPVEDLSGLMSDSAVPADARLYLRNKKTEQAHLMIGFPAYEERHPDHYALNLLNIVLGGNMSSRMFLSVRERQGLAYYIGTSSDEYTDTGHLATNAGVSLDGIDKAITAILAEYDKVVAEAVPESELTKAKEYIKGKLVLRLEDSEEYAHLMGKYSILYDEVKTLDEIMKEVEKVTVDDMLRVARDLYKRERLYLAVIGPYEDRERFTKLMG